MQQLKKMVAALKDDQRSKRVEGIYMYLEEQLKELKA